MLVASKRLRPGGSVIDIDGVEYHFVVLTNGAHVCDVTDKDHIARLLSITEGFEVYNEADVLDFGAEPPAEKVPPGAASDQTSQSVETDGKSSPDYSGKSVRQLVSIGKKRGLKVDLRMSTTTLIRKLKLADDAA